MAPSKEERSNEIWSTRIQQELLALTTDNADMESTQQVRSMLPPFVTLKEHKLDITAGECFILFEVQILKKVDGQEGVNVMVKLDASLPKKDNKVNWTLPCYPFVGPVPSLASGEEHFPEGSTIRNEGKIAMDLDWTPSLHLADAILNIGLKIRESIMQGEPFHPAPAEEQNSDEVAKTARGFASSITKKASSSFTKAFSNQARPKARPPPPPKKKPITPGEIKIGDEINMLEEPWVEARGVYSCKAIRRPPFVEDAMAAAAQKAEQQSFSSPQAMFRSFTQSARSVLEESFLMITETHIIELKSSKLNMSSGTVAFAISIDLMAKLKFRRQESLSLFFKPAPDDPLIYMCPDCGDAVHQIQSVLKQKGVRGKHTNAAAYRAINDAMQLVQEIQTKELALKHDPTVERVNDIMDLYRQAAERFEVAGDIRHEEVVTHMRKFLALPLTTSILDGSFKKPEQPTASPLSKDGKPVGEILERSDDMLDEDDAEITPSSEKEKENDKQFEENMDNLLKEVKEDFKKLLDDGSTMGADTPSVDSEEAAALAEVAADLDAMMREADKELADLMKS